MNDEPEFELYVSEISPRGRNGKVEFTFKSNVDEISLRIDLPYYDAETIDAGVKEAARELVIFAEALAVEARGLAA